MRLTTTALMLALSGFATPVFAGEADLDDPKPAAARDSSALRFNPPAPDPGISDVAFNVAKAAPAAHKAATGRPMLLVRRK